MKLTVVLIGLRRDLIVDCAMLVVVSQLAYAAHGSVTASQTVAQRWMDSALDEHPTALQCVDVL